MKIIWTKKAMNMLLKLPKLTQRQIIKKLDYWFFTDYPLYFSRQMTGIYPPQFRFRIGKYRVIGEIENNSFLILKVGHRKNIYSD